MTLEAKQGSWYANFAPPGEARGSQILGDNDISCEVRGGFGNSGDKAEDLIPVTRWINLTDLVAAMDKQQLKKLFTFAGKLHDVLKLCS